MATLKPFRWPRRCWQIGVCLGVLLSVAFPLPCMAHCCVLRSLEELCTALSTVGVEQLRVEGIQDEERSAMNTLVTSLEVGCADGFRPQGVRVCHPTLIIRWVVVCMFRSQLITCGDVNLTLWHSSALWAYSLGAPSPQTSMAFGCAGPSHAPI